MELTHRERFKRAMTHETVDRAVYDLCGCPQTLIDAPDMPEELLAYLGLKGPKQGDFPLDERILERFDIDTRIVGGMPTPKTVHNRVEGEIYFDSYGIGSRFINGHYEFCYNPLKGATIDKMLAWPMPDAANIDISLIKGWAEKAKYLHENTDYAVVAEHPVLGVFEIGCWLFGFDDYFYRLAAEPELVHAFSERVLGYQKKVIDIYYGMLGPYIDCTTSGDDFGMQTSSFMSAAMFQEMIKPYLKERITYTKNYTNAFYQHHTCGSVYVLIPDLVDCGIDILNPIQPGTYMMEPERLKKDFGSRLSFWGGIDTQKLLPEGSVEDVRAAVSRILTIMGTDGGYILSPAHCIQPDVPVANLAAIYDF
jgi:uroporphyrinogen decarboxylase